MKSAGVTLIEHLQERGYREVAPGVLCKVPPPLAPVVAPQVPSKRTFRDYGVLDRRFKEVFTKAGGNLGELQAEYRFHPTRKWRADYFHLTSNTLIEIEGGLHAMGRHNKADGFVRDAQKYNAATAMGFRLFRLPSKLITEEYLRDLVEWLRNPAKLP